MKVEFPDKAAGTSEWMWRVSRCDDEKQLVFGTLDSEPLNDYDGKVALGSEVAVSFSQIREHRKPTEFTKQWREIRHILAFTVLTMLQPGFSESHVAAIRAGR